MADIDLHKTVFLSYRREPSRYLALAIFKELEKRGYDVFWDIESIGAGRFDEIILKNIAARAHFVVILTEKTLERCVERGDWLRREIEYAMELKRAIIPLMVDEFTFKTTTPYLKGKLKKLPTYNGMPFYYSFFDAGIDKLCNQYLTNTQYGKIIPLSTEAQAVSSQIVEAVMHTPSPTQQELNAEQYSVRAYSKQEMGDIDGAIADFNEALRLNPEYAIAFNNRGMARGQQGDTDGAIADFNEALRLNPEYAIAYYNRGIARALQGDHDRAIVDFNHVIHINSDDAAAYYHRGNARSDKGDMNEAIADYNEALRLNPIYVDAYHNRGLAQDLIGNLKNALSDYTQTLKLDPNFTSALGNRGELYFALGQYKNAFDDLSKVNKIEPNFPMTLGALAITHHALGNTQEAKQIWQGLVEQDARYMDAEWVKQELNWAEPLVQAARKLIAAL